MSVKSTAMYSLDKQSDSESTIDHVATNQEDDDNQDEFDNYRIKMNRRKRIAHAAARKPFVPPSGKHQPHQNNQRTTTTSSQSTTTPHTNLLHSNIIQNATSRQTSNKHTQSPSPSSSVNPESVEIVPSEPTSTLEQRLLSLNNTNQANNVDDQIVNLQRQLINQFTIMVIKHVNKSTTQFAVSMNIQNDAISGKIKLEVSEACNVTVTSDVIPASSNVDTGVVLSQNDHLSPRIDDAILSSADKAHKSTPKHTKQSN
jgi:hypothetical protein